jgi:hypothetical protein
MENIGDDDEDDEEEQKIILTPNFRLEATNFSDTLLL